MKPIDVRTNLARELRLRVWEAQLKADRLRPHWTNYARELLSAPAALAQVIHISNSPQPLGRP